MVPKSSSWHQNPHTNHINFAQSNQIYFNSTLKIEHKLTVLTVLSKFWAAPYARKTKRKAELRIWTSLEWLFPFSTGELSAVTSGFSSSREGSIASRGSSSESSESGSRYKTLDMSERVQPSEAKTRGLPAKKKNWELVDKRSQLNYRNNLTLLGCWLKFWKRFWIVIQGNQAVKKSLWINPRIWGNDKR